MMKDFEQYIDSGLEWVGLIPQRWKQTQLKYISSISKGKKAKDDFQDYQEGMIPYLSMEYLRSQTESPSFVLAIDPNIVLVDEQDLLILWDGSKAGEIVKAKKGALSSTMGKIHVTSDFLDINYLTYYLKNAEPFIQANTVGMGIPHVSGEVLRTLYITFPNIEEQTKIAQYLDHQTAIIDQLIQQKEKLIELLKEKRQAVINEAVTKGLPTEAAAKAGLNPNAKMKDSGIEWLGEVPEGWALRNMEIVARNDRYSITGGPFGSDLKNEEYTEEGVRIIQLQNIGVGEFRDEYKIYTSEEKADYLFSSNIYPGEIIIAKMADPVARACIVPNSAERFIMASDGIRLEVDKTKYNTKYIEYSLNSKYFNYQAELNSTGTTRLRIGLTSLKKLKLILPNLDEQNVIVEYLESYNQFFLESLNKLDKQLDKLKEYRQSIISEAVTGKIDVRDWEVSEPQIIND